MALKKMPPRSTSAAKVKKQTTEDSSLAPVANTGETDATLSDTPEGGSSLETPKPSKIAEKGRFFATEIVLLPTGSLRAYDRNARIHSKKQIRQLQNSIVEFGFTNPILATPSVEGRYEVIAGHGRLEAAKALKLESVPVIILSHLKDSQKRALILADNKIADNASWDMDMVNSELETLQIEGFDLELTGFDALKEENAGGGADTNDELPKYQDARVSQEGDIWILGNHRVCCGDSNNADAVKRLVNNKKVVDLILTDPPYCSGCFQEAGRSKGSIGTERIDENGDIYAPSIANDRLSTRGYQSLMKGVLSQIQATGAFMFTDWRMWVNLYDIMEGAGYGVRSMIVWDKLSPGMGRGFRSQHELCAFGLKQTVEFDNTLSVGNVLSAKRTGNDLHPTQKPVEIIETMLTVCDWAKTVYDPFTGSGTTLIACQNLGRTFYGMELSPEFVDVIVKRFELHTGVPATLEATGETFTMVQEKRKGIAS